MLKEMQLKIKNNINNPITLPSMEGSKMPVWKISENKYQVAVPDGRYANGRLKYKREFTKTEEEAYLREAELLREIRKINEKLSHQEKKNIPDKLFKEVALKWLKRKKPEIAPKTWDRYKEILENHIIPAFGKRFISDIEEDEVRDYFLTNKNSGTTLRQHHTILKNIFAMEGIDVMKNIKRPRKNNTEINCIKDPVDLAEFVKSFKNSILFLPVYLASVTGMRLSEIAGLRWEDVNLKTGYITINRSLHWKKENGKKEWYVKSTKNGSSKRTIKISKKDVEVLQHIKDVHKKTQKDFVCVDKNNNPLCKDSVSSNFKARAKTRGFDVSFHSLRHSHATILIQHFKKSINAVSKRLGHANEITTLSIYASVLPLEDEDIASTMGEVMMNV